MIAEISVLFSLATPMAVSDYYRSIFVQLSKDLNSVTLVSWQLFNWPGQQRPEITVRCYTHKLFKVHVCCVSYAYPLWPNSHCWGIENLSLTMPHM